MKHISRGSSRGKYSIKVRKTKKICHILWVTGWFINKRHQLTYYTNLMKGFFSIEGNKKSSEAAWHCLGTIDDLRLHIYHDNLWLWLCFIICTHLLCLPFLKSPLSNVFVLSSKCHAPFLFETMYFKGKQICWQKISFLLRATILLRESIFANRHFWGSKKEFNFANLVNIREIPIFSKISNVTI